MIDVQDLIARYSLEEHMAKADAYFEGVSENWQLRRKPWMDATEAQQLTRGLSLIFQGMELRPGLRLLDFGAGTCWSSIIFAYLGCDVVAADVSQIALQTGARIKSEDPIAKSLPISFAHIRSAQLPLPDEDVDRIVCIDCFHHVADQAGTLAEFYRVLRPGGRVAFSEPGPNHSRSPQSQHEMRTHGVIENDIVIEDIDRTAQNLGFLPMRVAYATPQAYLLDVKTFNRWRTATMNPIEMWKTMKSIGDGMAGRTFFLWKPGEQRFDSRGTQGLSGALAVDVRYLEDRLSVKCTMTNTGAATWLPSGGPQGCVNLGVQLQTPDGFVTEANFMRVEISATSVAPGEQREVTFDVQPPAGDVVLVFDLVSEFVAWFSQLGITPVRHQVRRTA